MLPNKDIVMEGHVSWTGGAVTETSMVLSQERAGVFAPLLRAKYVMISLDPLRPGKTKPTFPLVPEDAAERAVFEQGQLAALKRKQDVSWSCSPAFVVVSHSTQ